MRHWLQILQRERIDGTRSATRTSPVADQAHVRLETLEDRVVPTTSPILTTPLSVVRTGPPAYNITGTAPAGSTLSVFRDNNDDNLINGSDSLVALAVLPPGQTRFSVAAPLIHDAANNFLIRADDGVTGASSLVDVPTITEDSLAPSVVSITRAAGSPTSADSISFSVTFNEHVTGVDASDFRAVLGGTTSVSPTLAVTGNGNSYTVTVGSITGDGTVQLNLVDDDSIKDLVANPLGDSGAENGNATGEAYVIDNTGPAAPVIDNFYFHAVIGAPVKMTLEGAVTGTSGEVVTVRVFDGTTPHGNPVSVTIGSSGTARWSVTTEAPPLGDYHYTATVTDAAGNVSSLSAPFLVDLTPPSVTISSVPGQPVLSQSSVLNFMVGFSEPVTGFTASDVVVATGAGTAFTGTPEVTITPVGTDGALYNVAVRGMNRDGSVSISIPASVVSDAGNRGNTASTDGPVLWFADATNEAPVNTAPTSIVQGAEDEALTLTGGNRLSVSDPDAGHHPLSVLLQATNGTLSLGATTGLTFVLGDGTGDAAMLFTGSSSAINAALDNLVFTPTANYSGPASIQITTSDQGNTGAGGARSDTDVIQLAITPQPDAPQAVNDAATTLEDSATTIDVRGNDTNAEGSGNAGLAVVRIRGQAAVAGTPITLASGATATLNANGTITYAPAANFQGTDTFEYTISDDGSTSAGHSSTATVTVNVLDLNDAPVVSDGTFTTSEGTSVQFDLRTLTSDVETPDASLTYRIVSGPSNGFLLAHASERGVFSYQPLADFNGTDTILYQVDDGSGFSNVATVRFTVASVNSAPVLTPISPWLPAVERDQPENLGQTVGTLIGSSITDADSGAARGIAVLSMATTVGGQWEFQLAGSNTWTSFGAASGEGSLLLRDVDRVRFVPSRGAGGGTAQFEYVAWDQTGTTAGKQGTRVDASVRGNATPFSTASDTARISASDTNDPPTAVADTATTSEDGPALTINLTGNDTDPEGDVLTVISVDTTGLQGVIAMPSTTGNTPITSILYSPTGLFDALPAGQTATDTFTYTVRDAQGGTSTATVTITITGVNDAPVANADTATVSEGSVVSIDVLANDTDVDNPAPAPSNPGMTVTAVGAAAHGTVTITGFGTGVSYTPFPNYYGTDTFTYTVGDGNGGSSTATVTMTVNPTFLDDFNRTASGSLGGDWTNRTGSFGVSAGQAIVAPGSVALSTVNGISLANVSLAADVTVPALAGTGGGLVLRYSPTTGNLYQGGILFEAGVYKAFILRIQGGAITMLRKTPLTGFIGSGNVRFAASGSNLTLSVDGVLRVAVIDSTFTQPGLVGWRGMTATFDNLVVNTLQAGGAAIVGGNTLPSFRDTFTRAMGSPLDPIWNTQAGVFRIESETAVGKGVLNVATHAAATLTNVSLSADVMVPAVDGTSVGLVARYSGTGEGNAYVGRIRREGSVYLAEIVRKVGNVVTPLVGKSLSGFTGTGKMRFEVVGTSLKLFLGDVLQLSTTDAGLTSGGVGMRTTGAGTLDNLTVDSI